MTTRVPRRHVFHVHHQAYHIEDSYRGVRQAIRLLYPWIDLDCHKSLDGTLWITHWPEPMVHDGFHDEQHLLPLHTAIQHMHDSEVERLVTKDGYRIHKAVELVCWALKHGIKVELEAKTSAITKQDFLDLRDEIVRRGLNPDDVQVKGFPQFRRSLQAAYGAHFKTVALCHHRGIRLSKGDEYYLTYYRGHRPEFV